MWLFLSVLAVCSTLIYLARTLGPPKLEVLISPQPQPPQDPLAEPLPVPPIEIQLFCAAESEPHARQDLLARAHKLYGEYGDWVKVLNLLKKQEEGE